MQGSRVTLVEVTGSTVGLRMAASQASEALRRRAGPTVLGRGARGPGGSVALRASRLGSLCATGGRAPVLLGTGLHATGSVGTVLVGSRFTTMASSSSSGLVVATSCRLLLLEVPAGR